MRSKIRRRERSKPTRADLVARTPDGIVHVEFVKDPTPNFDQRMVDYRLRLRRRDRHTALSQYVLVLRDVPVPDHYTDPGPDLHSCTWTVVHLHRLDPDALLTSPPPLPPLPCSPAAPPPSAPRSSPPQPT